MSASTATTPLFRAHSKDCYVRVSPAVLLGLPLQHLHTEEDPSVLADAAAALGSRAAGAGFTEWAGQDAAGRSFSIGWDWALSNGHLCMLGTVPPRSNVMLLDEKGYDLPQGESQRRLTALINELPWKRVVLQALRDERSLTCVGH